MQTKDQRDKIIRKSEKVNVAYKQVFSGADGEEVIKDLISLAGLMSSTESLDHAKLAFREGQRDIIFRILHAVDMDISEYIKKLREVKSEQEEIFK